MNCPKQLEYIAIYGLTTRFIVTLQRINRDESGIRAKVGNKRERLRLLTDVVQINRCIM